MYESWGCVTLSYAAPGRALYMAGQGAELVNIAARLAALTTELCVGENPVMVHCLGLNSVSVYNHIREVNTLTLDTLIACMITFSPDPVAEHKHSWGDIRGRVSPRPV